MAIDPQKLNACCEAYQSQTIAQLDHILSNRHLHSAEELVAAQKVIQQKCGQRRDYNQQQVDAIHEAITNKENYFDFQVFNYDGSDLVMAGSYDLTYGHNLEIIFESVSFVHAPFHRWSADFEKRIIELPDPRLEKKIRKKFSLLNVDQLFLMHPEPDEFDGLLIIAATTISFNQDTVLYNYREDLEENMRLADIVTGNKKNGNIKEDRF